MLSPPADRSVPRRDAAELLGVESTACHLRSEQKTGDIEQSTGKGTGKALRECVASPSAKLPTAGVRRAVGAGGRWVPAADVRCLVGFFRVVVFSFFPLFLLFFFFSFHGPGCGCFEAESCSFQR